MASLVLFDHATRQHERASRCETARPTTSLAMPYISTRGKTAPMGFGEAVMTGLARDGGLLLPAEIPHVSDRLPKWRELSYRRSRL